MTAEPTKKCAGSCGRSLPLKMFRLKGTRTGARYRYCNDCWGEWLQVRREERQRYTKHSPPKQRGGQQRNQNKFKEPLPLAPFLGWTLQREAFYRRVYALYAFRDRKNDPAIRLVLKDLGWDNDAGSRRYYRWRHESATGMAERAMIEDALDCAGIGFWEVYPQVAEEDEKRWEKDPNVRAFLRRFTRDDRLEATG